MTNTNRGKVHRKLGDHTSLSYYNINFSSPTKHIVRDKRTSKIFVVKVDPSPGKASSNSHIRSNSAPPNFYEEINSGMTHCGPQCIPVSLSRREMSRTVIAKKTSNIPDIDATTHSDDCPIKIRVHVNTRALPPTPQPPTTTPENSDDEESHRVNAADEHSSERKDSCETRSKVETSRKISQAERKYSNTEKATKIGNGLPQPFSSYIEHQKDNEHKILRPIVSIKKSQRSRKESPQQLGYSSSTLLHQTPISSKRSKHLVLQKQTSCFSSDVQTTRKGIGCWSECNCRERKNGKQVECKCHQVDEKPLHLRATRLSREAWKENGGSDFCKIKSLASNINASDEVASKNLLPQYQQILPKAVHVNDILVGLKQLPQKRCAEEKGDNNIRPVSNYRMKLINRATTHLLRNVQLAGAEEEQSGGSATKVEMKNEKKVKFKFSENRSNSPKTGKQSPLREGKIYQEVPTYANSERRKTIEILAVKPPIQNHKKSYFSNFHKPGSTYKYETITLSEDLKSYFV